ncbi:MAG: helix-turn-helix domain-containing protein [Chloroflexi bacterium]|nr:helix-turn-helix domain-containing protein [Chloroflexota bacterium]
MLGVHPSTVRQWSDQGRLPVYRTQGGHRRYLRSEVTLWKQTQDGIETIDTEGMVENAIGHLRIQIDHGHLDTETWYRKLDAEAREQYRISGRLISEELFSPVNGPQPSAWSIGHDYASQGKRNHLTRAETVQAYLFFRNALLDSLMQTFEEARIHSSAAWAAMLHKTLLYTDQILLSILDNYGGS